MDMMRSSHNDRDLWIRLKQSSLVSLHSSALNFECEIWLIGNLLPLEDDLRSGRPHPVTFIPKRVLQLLQSIEALAPNL
jgi:hypothetical protein